MTTARIRTAADRLDRRAEPDSPRRWISRADALAALVVAAAVLVVYGSILRHPFLVFDDSFFITGPELWSSTLTQLGRFWLHSRDGLYVPLARTAWWGLNWLSDGPSPLLCHAASLIVHLCNALLVYALIRRLGAKPLAAVGGALIFALHPLQVESVAWASELKDLLGGFFGVLFLLAYVQPELAGRKSDMSPIGRWLLLPLLLTAAILSKPSAVVMPLLAGVIDWGALGTPFGTAAGRAGGLVLVALPWIIVGHASQPGDQTDLWQRPIIALHTEAAHLTHALLPLDPVPDYGLSPSRIMAATFARHLLAMAIVLAAVAVVVWQRRRLLATGLLVLMLAPLPALGFVPFDFEHYSSVADHYLYVGLLGLGLMAADLLRRMPRRIAIAVLIATCATAGALSMHVCGRWSSDLTLWTHNVQANPDGALAWANYAAAVWRADDPGTVQASVQGYERSLQLDPEQPLALDNLVIVLSQAGQVDRAIAAFNRFPPIRKGLRFFVASHIAAESSLGDALMAQKRPREAAFYYTQALRLDRSNQAALEGLRAAVKVSNAG